jgi:hypothetical protein
MPTGRFVSADGSRQVRMGDGEMLGTHGGGPHLNFNDMAADPARPGKMTQLTNIHVFLTDALR